MEQKRQKNSNFTTKETEMLIALVQKHREGVTCNKTDAKNEIRKETWIKITDEFNSSNESFRNICALKNRYKNIKSGSIRKFAESKSYSRGTGGGPPKPANITSVDEIIKEIHGTQVTGGSSKYDGDSCQDTDNYEFFIEDLNVTVDTVEINENNPPPSPDEEMVDENINSGRKPDEIPHNDWSAYNPLKLRQAKDTALCVKKSQKTAQTDVNTRKRPADVLKTKIGAWAKTKVELNDIHKTMCQEEQKLKLEHLKIKHQTELKLMEEESKKRMQLMEEESTHRRLLLSDEHKIKLEILILQIQRLSNIKN